MPAVIAHRGASGQRRENTLEAFATAIDLGADAVELDVRRTRDGALVVHHDAHLEDGRSIVACDAAELPAHVPSLAAALEACGQLRVNVEIKNARREPDFDPDDSVAAGVVALVSELGIAERILVSSFRLATIDAVRRLAPDLATGFLTIKAASWTVERTVERGHGAYHPWDGVLTHKVVDAARSAGLEVNVWTVDDPERMAKLAGWGVDGIVTNVADVARRVLEGL